jgi:hypothetical protein
MVSLYLEQCVFSYSLGARVSHPHVAILTEVEHSRNRAPHAVTEMMVFE